MYPLTSFRVASMEAFGCIMTGNWIPNGNPGQERRVGMTGCTLKQLRLWLPVLIAFAVFRPAKNSLAADGYTPFGGEKTSWHEGFDRYDFVMDDATGAITPMIAPE